MNAPRMNFGDAEPQNDFSEMIPAGALAFGVLNIKWFNADQGIIETQSKSSDARFLDCSVTLCPNPANGFVTPWNKRKVFTRIGVAGSEKYVNMGRSAIKAILETGRGAGPANMDAYNIGDYSELDGLTVAVKIKVEPGTADFPKEKNDVSLWLSPIDEVTRKDWTKLMANDVVPAAKPGAAARPAAAWANGAGAAQSTPAQTQDPAGPPAAPGWLNNGGGQAAANAAPVQAPAAPGLPWTR